MTVSKHILFTARDIGAGHHLMNVIRAFGQRNFKTTVIASPPSYDLFCRNKIKSELFLINDSPCISNKASFAFKKKMLDQARHIIERHQPDVIFCGLSSADHGVDEAMLYWASPERMNIPSFQYLDCGGTFNQIGDGYPYRYFGIDRSVVRYSNKRARSLIEVVGSPKHEEYSRFPTAEARLKTRRRLRITPSQKLIGYFGQDPRLPGYMENFGSFISAVKKYKDIKPYVLMLRGHPGYKKYFSMYRDVLKKYNVDAIETNDHLRVEDLLVACDAAVTCFSTVGIDHAYLNHYASRPTGGFLYIVSNQTIKDFLIKSFGFWKNPLLERGIGSVAASSSSIFSKLKQLLDDPLVKKQYFQKTKTVLNQHQPSERMVKRVSAVLKGWKS